MNNIIFFYIQSHNFSPILNYMKAYSLIYMFFQGIGKMFLPIYNLIQFLYFEMIAQAKNNNTYQYQVTLNKRQKQQLQQKQNLYSKSDQKQLSQRKCFQGIQTMPTQEKQQGLMQDLNIDDTETKQNGVYSPTTICLKLYQNSSQIKDHDFQVKQIQKPQDVYVYQGAGYSNAKYYRQYQKKQVISSLKKSLSTQKLNKKIDQTLHQVVSEKQITLECFQQQNYIDNCMNQMPQKLTNQIEIDLEIISMTSKSQISNSEIEQSAQDLKVFSQLQKEPQQIEQNESIQQSRQEDNEICFDEQLQNQSQNRPNLSFNPQNPLLKNAQKQRLILVNFELNKHFVKYQKILINHSSLFENFIDKMTFKFRQKIDLFNMLRIAIMNKLVPFSDANHHISNSIQFGKFYDQDENSIAQKRQANQIKKDDLQEYFNQTEKHQYKPEQNPYINIGRFYSNSSKQMNRIKSNLKQTYQNLSKKLESQMLTQLKNNFDNYQKRLQSERYQILKIRNCYISQRISFLRNIQNLKHLGQKLTLANSDIQTQRDIFLVIVQYFEKQHPMKTNLLTYSNAINKFRKLFFDLEKQLMKKTIQIFMEFRNFCEQHYISIQLSEQESQLTVQDCIVFLQSEISNQFSFQNLLTNNQLVYLQELYNAATCSEQDCISSYIDYENQLKYEKAFTLNSQIFNIYFRQNCMSVRQLLKLVITKAFFLSDPFLQLIITFKNQLILFDWGKIKVIEIFRIEGIQMEMEIQRQKLRDKFIPVQKNDYSESISSSSSSSISPTKENENNAEKEDHGKYYLIIKEEIKKMFSYNVKEAKVQFSSMDKLQQFIFVIQNWQK